MQILLYDVILCCLQPIDKQSLLDSGILCCLVHILNALLGLDGEVTRQKVTFTVDGQEVMDNTGPDRRLEVFYVLSHIYTPPYLIT